eukprot:943641-Amphidinium_carterae.1
MNGSSGSKTNGTNNTSIQIRAKLPKEAPFPTMENKEAAAWFRASFQRGTLPSATWTSNPINYSHVV